MTVAQPGIFALAGSYYLALEYRAHDSAALRAAIAQIDASAPGACARVIAFGPALWKSLAPHAMPAKLGDFTAISGVRGFSAPATQADLLIWLHGPRPDLVFDAGHAAHLALENCATLEREVPGFAYHENRDLTGFIDGTANPQGDEAQAAALIADGTGAGGAYVMTQQYVHNLAAFNKLGIPEQEKVIGRGKADSAELDASVKPKDAHIARVEITEGGEELKIFRRSFPYGGVNEHGLYFLAFACDPHRFDAMLKNMFGVSGDGLHDHLLHFTRAVSGAYWFAPSQKDLAAIG